MHKIRTTSTILANGHIERFISFRNNDLPGIMLASSFEKYICRYGVIPDKEPVIFTNNSSTISLIKSLINLNCKPKAYIDSRKKKDIENEIILLLKENNIPFYPESEVEGCEGNKKVEQVFIRQGNSIISINTTMLCPSGGFNPDIHLFTQSKGLVKWDEKIISFKPDTVFQNTITLGSVSGNYNFDLLSDEVEKKLSHFKVNKFNTKIETNVTKKFSINEKWETKSAKNLIFQNLS